MSTQIEQFTKAPNPLDDQEVFDVDMARYVTETLRFVTQANALGLEMQINADVAAALILAMALPQFAGTSTSSVTVGTGTRTFTTQAGKGWIVGQIVVASSGANYVKGTVTNYAGTALELNVTSINGSGTYAAWDIGLSYDGLALAKSGVNNDIIKLVGITDYTGSLAFRLRPVGLALSTAGASSTMTVAPGVTMDSTNTMLLQLGAVMDKTTAAWVAGSGNGGLDAGTVVNNTWYTWYIIRRPDTGAVDLIFSTNNSAPTLPANYTQYEYLGQRLTNGSGQWVKFTQFGDEVIWAAPILDLNAVGSSTATLLTCSVPRGRKVKALLSVHYPAPAGTDVGVYISSPDSDDLAPSFAATPLVSVAMSNTSGGALNASGQVACWTNSLAQIRHREFAGNTLRIATLGWIDLRGKEL